MCKITINSTRVYYKELNYNDASLIKHDIKLYQKIKNTVYKRLYENDHYGCNHKLSSTVLKKEFNTNDYMPLSAISEAKGIYQSSVTSNKRYKASLSKRIDKTLKKIEKEEAQLNEYLNTKQSLIEYSKGIREDITLCKGLKQIDNNYCMYNHKRMLLYIFEVQYLNPIIKEYRNRIRLLRYRLNRLKYLLSSKDHMICMKKRNYMKITGRSQGKYCNNLFKYDYTNHTMTFITSDRTRISFQLDFPYRKEELIRVLKLPHASPSKAVCYTLTDYGEYFIIRATIELKDDLLLYVKDTHNGVVGIDINRNHISLSETDDIGNLIYTTDIPMRISNKSSNQRKWIIENTSKEILSYCKCRGKPLIIENLDFSNTKSNLEIYNSNKSYNQMISSFAYRIITEKLYARSIKDQISVIEVSPSYTSQIGKEKYSKVKGLSVHKCAAYVIARRGQGYKDRLN